ncbi:MAG: hypothetical protein HYZ92_02055 [Candidatus Omnitrophica bacterium]|nr:hypothetical protein [Candidatus Omnitrophota bacterium]
MAGTKPAIATAMKRAVMTTASNGANDGAQTMAAHPAGDHVDQTIPERLPLLDRYLAEQVRRRRPLAGVTAVLIQHQLGSQVVMTKALIELGIEPGRIHWIDIP